MPRWLDDSEVSISRYGAVQKTNEHSDPISEEKLSRLKLQAKSTGIAYVQNMIDYHGIIRKLNKVCYMG